MILSREIISSPLCANSFHVKKNDKNITIFMNLENIQ